MAGHVRGCATALGHDLEAFTRADLLAHHRLVTELFESVDACLPVRFPTRVADADALQAQLVAQEATLIRQLEQVRDKCELAVTLVWTTEQPSADVYASTPGRQYLLKRRQAIVDTERRQARAIELADAMERLGGADVLDARRRVCPSSTVALSMAMLIRRETVDWVRSRLGLISTEDVRILVNGPWPAYTFVSYGPE
jgi:hypothetical protein